MDAFRAWIAEGHADRLRKRDHGPGGVPDGYPTSTLGDGSTGGEPSRSPTLTAVLERQRLEGRTVDFVHACRVDMDQAERDTIKALRQMMRRCDEGLHMPLTEDAKARTVAGFCQVCERAVAGGAQDRLRAGYCPADYQAWRRWLEDNPGGDRSVYERHRRASIDDNKGDT